MKSKNLFLAIFLIPVFMLSQTKEERAKIASFSNKEANEKLMQNLKNEEIQRKSRLSAYFSANTGVNKIVKDEETGKVEIMDVLPNGELVYAKTDNAGAAITARANKLYSGGSLGLNIQGQNMTAGVWDGGNVRSTHQEFMVNGNSKVLQMDGTTLADHATHVAGTIAAQGIVSDVKGIAFNSSVNSYDWTGDLTEMLIEASGGLLASNHSYGFGSLSSLWFFGAYDSRAKSIDEICYNNPYYLPVFSAGNSRNSTESPASTQLVNKVGYDLIYGHGNAKNVLTVAAVGQVNNYVDEASVVMSAFSSWGPSDDGRIKPDISMKGVSVKSTLSSTNAATGIMSGTSMASPGITGVTLLLQQYHNSLYSSYMKAATLKGLILHTADETGNYLGPDYEYGWGLVNAEKAALTIRDKNLTMNKSVIEELNLLNGGTYTKTINASGTTPLKVSISWTDPQSPVANTGTVDPTTKYIVNDLDVKVTGPGGIIYYPWKGGGMSAPYDAASRNSQNSVDNFERIDIDNPSGQYTITITHKGALVNGEQPFSLIATSQNLNNALSTEENIMKNDDLILYPVPAITDLNIGSKKTNLTNYKIVDNSGRIVIMGKIDAERKINIRTLEKGQYIIIIRDSEGNYNGVRFIKK